ncbi:hypothetical protein NEOLI_004009 [Neolecta irregularis DAH-3]|uniref:Uncharacterized protein n=1 Tax=Neolecta irregularis (strain DAH-3) TaxID=1198029 RepID=A0A1U7LSK1_NEOID|nr:hypothetical protein NEOLI_004009 [Neolecta irregularis DAH-3]|eukprot:OLL25650.1 hypothetical protein NEOLI_004009 [Neolecta irregularis DAH-3]
MQFINAILAFAVSTMAIPVSVGVTNVPAPENESEPFLLLAHGKTIKSPISVDQNGNLVAAGDELQFTVDANNILRAISGGVAAMLPGTLGIYLTTGDYVPSGYQFQGYSIEEGTGKLKLNRDGADYGFSICEGNTVHAVRAGESLKENCESVEINMSVANSP